MRRTQLSRALGIVMLTIFAMTLMGPIAALAGTEGRRNTALGLTGAAIYAGVRGKKAAAIGLGAGAAYAWKRHADERTHVAYKRGYARGYHRGYSRAKHHYSRHYRH